MAVPRTLPARLRALPPNRLDALLGAALGLEVLVETLVAYQLEGARLLLGVVLAGIAGGAAALRRRAPLVAAPLAWSGFLYATWVGPDISEHMGGPFFTILFVAFTAGMCVAGRRLWALGAVGVALTAAAVALDTYADEAQSFLFSSLIAVGGPLVLGQLVRNRLTLNQALVEQAAQLERDRAEEAETAALEERTRIAGELHDVVAHAISAMTIQAGAARRLAERDPDRARAAFATAEGTGREALTELRRLLGVLRREDEELALAPQPSLVHVDGLVRRASAAGLPTRLVTEGTARPLPAGIDLTAYRLVQEALTAARDRGHAGHADVSIRFRDADVLVEVADDGASSGRRLLGMRERVAVYGGELSAAPGPDGGWRVAARLPVEAAS